MNEAEIKHEVFQYLGEELAFALKTIDTLAEGALENDSVLQVSMLVMGLLNDDGDAYDLCSAKAHEWMTIALYGAGMTGRDGDGNVLEMVKGRFVDDGDYPIMHDLLYKAHLRALKKAI